MQLKRHRSVCLSNYTRNELAVKQDETKSNLISIRAYSIVCYAIATVIIHTMKICENVNHIQFNYENLDTRMR